MNRIVNSEPTSIFGFTGRDFDKDVGLQATPNRRFNTVGRWLDADHVGYYQSEVHRYAVNRPE